MFQALSLNFQFSLTFSASIPYTSKNKSFLLGKGYGPIKPSLLSASNCKSAWIIEKHINIRSCLFINSDHRSIYLSSFSRSQAEEGLSKQLLSQNLWLIILRIELGCSTCNACPVLQSPSQWLLLKSYKIKCYFNATCLFGKFLHHRKKKKTCLRQLTRYQYDSNHKTV